MRGVYLLAPRGSACSGECPGHRVRLPYDAEEPPRKGGSGSSTQLTLSQPTKRTSVPYESENAVSLQPRSFVRKRLPGLSRGSR